MIVALFGLALKRESNAKREREKEEKRETETRSSRSNAKPQERKSGGVEGPSLQLHFGRA